MINESDYVKRPRANDDTRDDDDDDFEDVDDDDGRVVEDEESKPDVDSVLAQYADIGRKVLLDRWDGSVGRWVFLAKLDMSEAGLSELKARFGGGKYKMRILGEGMKQKRQVTFLIAGIPKDGEDWSPTISRPPSQSMSETQQILSRLEAIEKRTNGGGDTTTEILKLVVAAALRPQPVPQAPVRDPLVADLISALIKGGGNSGKGIDPIELQKLLQEARKEGLEQGRTLGEALSAAMGEGDGVARVLASTLPQVIDAFKGAQSAYTRAVPRAVPRPNQPATATATSLPTEEPTMPTGPTWIAALRPALPLLLKWAHTGKDAQIKAANTLDDLDDKIRDVIAESAEEPDFVATVLAAIPEMAAPDVQSWFTVYLSTIQEMLTTPDEGGELPGAEIQEG